MGDILLLTIVIGVLAASIYSLRVTLSHRKEIFNWARIKERWRGRPKWQIAVLIVLTPVALAVGWITAPHIPQPWGMLLTSALLIVLTLWAARTLRKEE